MLDALAAGGFPIGQMLGQRQRDGGIIGRGFGQALESLAGFFPAVGRAAQGLVILQRQRTIRRHAAEHGLVAFNRLLGLAALNLLAGLFQNLGARADLNGLAKTCRMRRVRMVGLQARQIGLRRFGMAGFHFDHAEAVQGLNMVRVDRQQFVPGFGRALEIAAREPVIALFHQDAGRIVLRLRLWRGKACQQRDHQGDESATHGGQRCSRRSVR